MPDLTKVYETLFARYGDLHWWPAKTPYEVMAGAVLTQNTAWRNVVKAIDNFKGTLTPEFVAQAEPAVLIDIIRPAGFFSRKAECLIAVTAWYAGYSYDAENVRSEPFKKIRAELCSVKGVGDETADSISLYAFDFLTFVVDAYTVRLCGRYTIETGGGYFGVKAFFESNLPKSIEIYKNFHALIIANAKEHCRKNKPLCSGCPLFEGCERRGINTVL